MIQITFQHFSETKSTFECENVFWKYLFYVLPFIANIFSVSHIGGAEVLQIQILF